MKVLFVSSEVAPFAKTGGLGDVAAALPAALVERGHDVRVVMPMYPRVQGPLRMEERAFEPVVRDAVIELGPLRVVFSVYASGNVYFVRCPALFDRPSLYTSDPDEHLRFVVLCWASLVLCQRLGFAPDIVHANDWQTSLLPLLLRTMFAWDRLFSRTRSVLTIHNIGHQGTFDARVLPETGLSAAAHHFHQDQLRDGRVNFLLTGILYANAITTVSPTYAREIQHPEHGVGLDGFLRERRDVLFGILNGIDESVWSPERDPLVPHRYSATELDGKEANKRVLLEDAGLPYVPGVPLVGVVSRLVWQKGFDLCFDAIPRFIERNAMQLVVLGAGEPKYEDFFAALARRFPRHVAYRRAFSEPLAHLIEAGADMFLMPSRYEPCGLNQMYSLRYGTLPIVHRTGGLADTVRHDNGFIFDHFDEGGLRWALGRALETWDDRTRWRVMQANGMAERFGWERRVGAYEAVYRGIAA